MERSHKKTSGPGLGLVVFGGILLLIGSVILLVGEIWTTKTGSLLAEAEKVMVEAGDLRTADPALEGKLLHAVGQVSTDDVLTDRAFGFSVGAILLKREVEYYQVVESTYEEKIGTDSEGDDITQTVYEYSRQWVDHPVNSARFYDKSYRGTNFTLVQTDTIVQKAENVSFGAYQLSEPIRKQLTQRTVAPIGTIDPDVLAPWSDAAAREKGSRGKFVTVRDKDIYIGADPSDPRIGDVRISFKVVMPQEVSILATAKGDSLTYYYSESNARLAYLKQGNFDAGVMLKDQGDEKTETSGMGRFMGFLHALFGIWLILKGFKKRYDQKPWMEVITRGKPFWTAVLFAFGWTFFLCSLPWFAYTPEKAVCFLLGGAALVYLAYFLRTLKKY